MADAENNNRRIWDKVKKTNPKFTTPVQQRGGFTAIDVYWQIEQATSLWGPYGSTWGLQDIVYSYIHEIAMCIVQAKFHYPDGVFEIGNSIEYRSEKGKVDDEFIKKIETNTISKALSRLGFSADVFTGLFDDVRYREQMNIEFGNPLPQKPATPVMPTATGSAPVGMPPKPGAPAMPQPPPGRR